MSILDLKLTQGQNLNAREAGRFQNLKVVVIGNQANSIGSDGTIYKLVVVRVLRDEVELKEYICLFDVWADDKKVGKIFSDLRVSFTSQDFSIF